MIISYIALVTLLTVVNLSFAEKPGARIILTQKGLNYGLKKFLPYLKSTLNDISIPGFSGKKYTCSYQLNIHIGNIDLPELSLTTGKNGLTMKADDVTMSGGVDYSYKCLFGTVDGSGSVDLGVSDSSLSLTILVDKDGTGHPLLKPNGCSLDISTFSIEFHGSLSWLANEFKGVIEDKIKSYANADACSKLSDLIKNQGNSFFEGFNTKMPIDNKIVIDYSLVNNPVFTSVDLQVGIKGEFTSIDPDAEKPPFTPSPIPQVTEASKMVYLVATSYLANTAAFVIQEEGYFKYNVTPDTIPTGKMPFNTIIFQELIPEFYNKYPEMNLTLNMYSTKPPILKITTEGAILQGCGVIEVGVYDANCDNAIVHAFSLEVEGSTEVEVGLIQVDSKTNITGKVDTLDLKISVKDTEIGAINTTKITDLIHSLGNQLIIPIVNRYLSVGWPIPAKYGVELENSELTLGKDYVLIGTDIKYEIQQPVQQAVEAVEHNHVSPTQTSSKSKKLNSRVQF